MGRSYTEVEMVGVYFLHKEEAKAFCLSHGHSCDEEHWQDALDDVHPSGFNVCKMNSWSGDGYIIGFYVSDDTTITKLKNKFKKMFGGVKAEYFVETKIH